MGIESSAVVQTLTTTPGLSSIVFQLHIHFSLAYSYQFFSYMSTNSVVSLNILQYNPNIDLFSYFSDLISSFIIFLPVAQGRCFISSCCIAFLLSTSNQHLGFKRSSALLTVSTVAIVFLTIFFY